uniref:Malonyl-CoA/methylmalonyl-CoA synthetase n=1 Tax=Candidatus Kentrum sp. DK TaxID=2126562 RepID=A0A450SBK9_9GAMM|nr:MAG: malonyl-CoA/methylmalonyl-CoA synthetase [Candidatus Kentron sp. DK]
MNKNANLYTSLSQGFPSDDNRTVIETPQGRTWSYRDLERKTARFAGLLAGLGIGKGERVAVLVEKSPEALFLYLACLRAGISYLPLNTAYQLPEIDYFLSDAEPKAIVCRPEAQDELLSLAERRGIRHVLTLGEAGEGTLPEQAKTQSPGFETVPCRANDTAAILYTSGTTGQPKGAMLTHGNLASNARILQQFWRFTPSDTLLHALPLFHVHGLFVACHCVLISGAKMRLLPRFEAESVLAALPGSTVFMGVPTHYSRLLAEDTLNATACATMRLFISGSAPLPENIFHAFRARTRHTILERYGMTETLMNTSCPYDGERKPGSAGPALPGVSIRIVDPSPEGVGAIEIKGPNVFQGYWRQPEKTAEEFTPDGWFRTGDLGRLDGDDYLFIAGRGKELIITGGYNVYPREVERAIDAIDGVRESAVIGLPDADFGERVTAVVVPEPEGQVSSDGIIEALKTAIANYKIPKQVLFADELPRNAMGKVQKNRLRERMDA